MLNFLLYLFAAIGVVTTALMGAAVFLVSKWNRDDAKEDVGGDDYYKS